VAPSCGAAAISGVVRQRERNWSKRSGKVVRAGGSCTWATPSSGTKKVRRPFICLSFRPMIWQGSGSVCTAASG